MPEHVGLIPPPFDTLSHDAMCERFGSRYAESFAAVPSYVFTPGFNDTITTPSGNQLVCEVSNRPCVNKKPHQQIHIFDPTSMVDINEAPEDRSDPTFRFTADLFWQPGVPHYYLSFYMRNRNPLGPDPHARHPDIHPSCLARRALDYFEAHTDSDIEHMRTWWTPTAHNGLPVTADNWRQYHHNLQRAAAHHMPKRQPTEADKLRAAANTMSGRLAAWLGMSELIMLDDHSEPNVVACTFSKPWWRDPKYRNK